MKSYLPILFFFFIVFTPLVFAEDVIIPFNKGVDLKRGCFDSGLFCEPAFECNITIMYPDKTLLFDNEPMTNQGSYYNITIIQPNNNQLGVMEAIQSCYNGTKAGRDTFNIEVTADGNSFRVFPTQFAVIIFSFILISSGFFIERLKLLTLGGSILMMLMGVVTLYPGYSFINHSTLMGKGVGTTLIGLGFYFLIQDNFSRSEQDERFTQPSEEEFLDD